MKVMILLVSLVLVSCTSKPKGFQAYDSMYEKPSVESIQAPAEGTNCYVTISTQENNTEII